MTDGVPASVKVAQAVVGALGVLVVAAIAGRARRPPPGASLAAFDHRRLPAARLHPAYAFSEALFWPIGLLVAWSIERRLVGARPRCRRRRRPARGPDDARPAAVSCRSMPLAGLWLLWRRGLRRRWSSPSARCSLLAPWSIRNYAHHGRFVLVASEGGITFWTGNHPLATGDGDMAANPEIKRANTALRTPVSRSHGRANGARVLS